MTKSKFNKKIGNYLKSIRNDKGLSQMDFASLIGVNPQNISAIERGEVSPTLFWLHNLCEAIEMPQDKFFQEFYEEKNN